MTILITGGYGFIGAAVLRLLLAESDDRVVNVDLETYAANSANHGPWRGSTGLSPDTARSLIGIRQRHHPN
jgi:dTDP-D-glucose 4,6-dehydratase